MSSRTGQLGFGWRGALLAVVMGLGWGCAELLGADFDAPFKQNEGGGGNGSSSSQSTGTTGGETPMVTNTSGGGTTTVSTSATSSAASSTSASGSTSSSSSSGSGGSVSTKTIYVRVDKDNPCSGSSDSLTTSDATASFGKLISQFKIMEMDPNPEPSDTPPLRTCSGKQGGHQTNIGDGGKCMTGGEVLGYVFNDSPRLPGLLKLKKLTAMGGNEIVVLEDSVCCGGGTSCTDTSYYALPAP